MTKIKISKFYIKIFLSFIILVIITNILFAFLMHLLAGNIFKEGFERYKNTNIYLIKSFVEDSIKRDDFNFNKDHSIKKIFNHLNSEYKIKTWVTAKNNSILYKSFTGDFPILSREEKKNSEYFHDNKRHQDKKYIYIKIPIKLKKENKGYINIYLAKKSYRKFSREFIIGLVILALILAILLWPFSQYITKPIKRFTDSALRIADGNLSERVSVSSNDEIGELGKAFNTMADKNEAMITGTKELTANISHELRSPLARVRVAEELLFEKMSDSEKNNYSHLLNSIGIEIDEMDKLIGQILQLTKLDTISNASVKKDTNIVQLFKEIIIRFPEEINVDIITNDQPDYIIKANRDDIKTAISNLIDNTIKYSSDIKNIRIDFYSNLDKEFVNISISNISKFISSDNLINIFNPFFRIPENEINGTGLGLAITKKTIENHNGKIWAEYKEKRFIIHISFPFVFKKGEVT